MAEPKRLQVLVVEDDPAMVSMLRALLDSEGYAGVRVAGTGAAALAPSRTADLILLDHQLPDTTGINLLPQLLARPDPPSVIMVTGEGNEELAAAALRLGAQDYLVKGPRLLHALPATLERARRNRMLRSTKAEVERDLVQAERLAAIGEMTVTLHHELNNPLMAATAEAELMLATEPGGAARHSLQVIKHALDRMRDILTRARALQQADRTAYLDGLRMIRLAPAGGPVLAAQGRAVLWAADEELARTTGLLLRHAGFSVDRVRTGEEATSEAGRLDTVLVLVAVAGAAPDPLQGFRPAPGRRHALVALVPGDPGPAAAAGADLVLTLPYDPAAFTGEILALTAAQPSP